MNKLYYIVFTLFLTLSVVKAQKRPFILKTNLLNFPLYSASLYLEVKQNDKKSNSFAFSIGNPAEAGYIIGSKYIFSSLSYSKRFYPKQYKAFSGFFVAPYVKYLYREQKREGLEWLYTQFIEEKDFKSHSICIGNDIGFQHLIKNKISIECILGLGVGSAFFTYGYATRLHFDGKFGVLVGYKF